MIRITLTAAFIVILSGCSKEPEKHVVESSGTERGIEIEVLLKGGGSAKLVCPMFHSEPKGAHGRECYLRSYDQ